MMVFDNIEAVRTFSDKCRSEGKTIGLVPTMGYLHEGHLSLIRNSAAQNDVTVISIFVNPIQFGAGEDFETYPRDHERDCRLAQEAGADAVFLPTPALMYPEGYATYVEVEGLTEGLCGAKRPGHFRGVTTVVSKLFHIIMPDRAYFGQKDIQQLTVIRKMVRDLNMGIEIVGCPIVREKDGLAMSSRNTYLSPEERREATVLSRAVSIAQERFQGGLREAEALKREMAKIIETAPSAKIDYIETVDANHLLPTETLSEGDIVAIAVYIGKTRLIDNCILHKNR